MDITNKNFNQEFDSIIKCLKKSCFIGFDAEFTAILSGECFKYRLFDTNKERYDRMKDEVCKMIMNQVGLTMFQYDRDNDRYISHTYTFHLCPQVFGDINQSFTFQASAIRFLCLHNFDYNKFTYDGLPYMSRSEEAHIKKQLKEKTLLNNLIQAMEMNDERKLQSYCSEVAKWLVNSTDDTIYLDIDNPIMRYIVHCELRNRFPEVLTTDSLGNSHKVLIYRNGDVDGATSASMSTLEGNLITYVLGFSQIIELLAEYKKPIIGHNMYLDTLLLHSQFIGPLPKRYSAFKKNINNLFPNMYDTKYISHEMGRKLTLDEVWKSNALQDLYEFFYEGKCKKLQKGLSQIKLNTPFDVKQSYHEAGWDSYCSGYCFIRLGEWSSTDHRGTARPASPNEIISSLSSYCNKVNVIRSAVAYMNLIDEDPPSHRPELLHIRSLREPAIRMSQVSSLLSGFGALDIKPYGARTALIAAGTHHTANKLLRHFNHHEDYRITPFKPFRHSPTGRLAIWGGALITGTIVIYFIHKKVNK
ncbi:Poly [Danaus plexippus plexippus]|uniref:Poly n=1 Tax=Danaus plexippus plexippus TaxID=278856 RepID=A0A212F817_DANPL|nr:Poly [Danaus plexippus plexippus]